jgi:hypothetical protein
LVTYDRYVAREATRWRGWNCALHCPRVARVDETTAARYCLLRLERGTEARSINSASFPWFRFIFSLTGRLRAANETGDVRWHLDKIRSILPSFSRQISTQKMAIATDDARCWSVPSKMTLQKLLGGPKRDSRPARVTGVRPTQRPNPTPALETWQHARYKVSSHDSMMIVVEQL